MADRKRPWESTEQMEITTTNTSISNSNSEQFIEKIYLNFTPLPAHISFIRNKIFGPQGSFLKHIQSTSKCRVQLRGKGSGYFEVKGPVLPGAEQEAMHLMVVGNDWEGFAEAKQLCEDLITTVKNEYDIEYSNYQYQYQYQYQAYLQAYYSQYYTNK